jgi:metal-sulfur cluster biosynthetic enzyme
MNEERDAALTDAVRDALRTVIDPEAGINIVELGLVYRIEITEGDAQAVRVDLTMTSPTCPMGDMILDEAQQAVSSVLPQGFSLDLQLVWEPAWGPERMSESARRTFGWDSDEDRN